MLIILDGVNISSFIDLLQLFMRKLEIIRIFVTIHQDKYIREEIEVKCWKDVSIIQPTKAHPGKEPQLRVVANMKMIQIVNINLTRHTYIIM